jgi:hypothetical protein
VKSNSRVRPCVFEVKKMRVAKPMKEVGELLFGLCAFVVDELWPVLTVLGVAVWLHFSAPQQAVVTARSVVTPEQEDGPWLWYFPPARSADECDILWDI